MDEGLRDNGWERELFNHGGLLGYVNGMVHVSSPSGPAADTSPAHLMQARHGARDPLLMGGRRSGGWHEPSGHPLREAVQAERDHAGDDAVHDRVAADQ